MTHILIFLVLVLGFLSAPVLAQERGGRYFVTYDHYLEEVDTLEIGTSPVLGRAHDLNTFRGRLD